ERDMGPQGQSVPDELGAIAESLATLLGPDHPRRGDVLTMLGRYYTASGHFKEAETVFRQALEVREHAPGVNDPSRAFALSAFGLAAASVGHFESAQDAYRRSIDAYAALGPEYESAVNRLKSSLAEVYVLTGRIVDAIVLHSE